MVSKIESQLFSILQSALGIGTVALSQSALKKADWSKVVDLAFEQGVASIAVDGLQRRLGVSGERI